jgi:cell division protein FtsB
MVFDTHYSRIKQHLAIGVLACFVVGYFTFHAFNGEHGIFANARYEERVMGLKSELTALKGQRQELEHRIALLKPESLDPDMLEERSRDTLNLAHPRDIMILKKE